jgi:hypothetical protein
MVEFDFMLSGCPIFPGAALGTAAASLDAATIPNPNFFLDAMLSPPYSSMPHRSCWPYPTVLCFFASQVGVVDVPLGTNFGSSICVNLSPVQTQSCAAKLVFWDRTFVR